MNRKMKANAAKQASRNSSRRKERSASAPDRCTDCGGVTVQRRYNLVLDVHIPTVDRSKLH